MFLRVEETGRNEWFFKRYRYQCDRCGKEFIRGKKDKRIKLCVECHKFDERQKARAKNNEQIAYIEKLENALDKAAGYLTYDHFTTSNELEGEEMAQWTEEEWKEFLLKDE